MSGINYNLRKIKAFVFDVDGVLSPSTITVNPEGIPMQMANVKDGYALQLAIKAGFKVAIISGGKNPVIIKRYSSLGIKDIFLGIAHKDIVLKRWMEDNLLSAEEVLYMGDDIPDYNCMKMVGLPCAPQDACYEIKSLAGYISYYNGGYGCVRDVIEQVLKSQGLWMKDRDTMSW